MEGLVYCVIPVNSEHQTLERIRQAMGRVDGIELRIDYNPSVNLANVLSANTLPVVVTNRTNKERGMYGGHEASRLRLLYQAIDLGAEMIDVEWSTESSSRNRLIEYARNKNRSVILSYHDFESLPEEGILHRVLDDSARLGCIPKIAAKVKMQGDTAQLKDVARKAQQNGQDYIIIPMGEEGRDGRLYFGKGYIDREGWGSLISYFPLTKEEATAPGQITLDEYLEHHFKKQMTNELPEFDKETVGIFGGRRPSTYSISPKIWGAAFDAENRNAQYVCFDVPNEKQLENAVKLLRKMKAIKGFNVTVPYKNVVMPFLSEISKDVELLRAVNVVKRDKCGKFHGINTDVVGFLRSLEEEGVPSECKYILQIGAGGAGRATAYAMAKRIGKGGKIVIANRTPENARDVAESVGQETEASLDFCSFDEIRKYIGEVDMIVNTTVIGNKGSQEGLSPLTLAGIGKEEISKIPKETIFVDIVFNPEQTVFLRQGKETGHKTINGKGMLLHQAIAGYEDMFDTKATLEMLAAMRKAIG